MAGYGHGSRMRPLEGVKWPFVLVQQKLRVPGLNSFLMKNFQIVHNLGDALR